ncbi:uncharacterized protein LOC105179100 [Sesamum indicum]|uniref:Uncharacterized protein LOC105179100 n=1 Tax=Sesamum indicum TaxID=4182 RepID=A0A6I9UQL9_SESIN|nr:uncharacterized protein LOC105179100 [Sesamum indicum]
MVADHGAVNVEEVHVDGDGSDDLACEMEGHMANFGVTQRLMGLFSNRIWLAWDDNYVDVDVLALGPQFIHARVRIAHEPLIITVIYGANEVAERRELWESLECFAPLLANIPWMVGGDFNAIRDLTEGEWFTWHNCSASPRNLWKRLDRILTNGTWMRRYPTLFYTCLAPRTSDHSPMHEVVGIPMYAITRKLKALKPVFREQRKNKRDLSHNVQLAKGFLDMTMLQQRAKMQWMKGGDQCPRIFFRKIAQRRAARKILQINDPHGTTLTEPDAMAHEFVTFFQSLLGGNRRQDVIDLRHLRLWAWHLLDEEEACILLGHSLQRM